ncbi:MAG: FAD:protein FMN transferase [Microvirga sp.]
MVDPLREKYGSRAKVLLPLLLVGFVALSAWRMWPREAQQPQAEPGEAPSLTFCGPTICTTYKITVVAALIAGEQQAIEALIAEELAEVDRQMSTWRDDSEISRFNAHVSTDPFPASRGLLEVVQTAAEISKASEGAFDVTVTPLIAAWGFGPKGRQEGAPEPTQAELDALRASVGWQRVHVDLATGSLRKDHPALRLELSAIAPGYAADRIASRLRELGHTRSLVDVGGEILASGESARGGPWRLGIERPDSSGGVVQQLVLVRDQALATSGDYRNYYEQDGVRRSHTIDPRTGRPIAHALASVSVLHRTAALADGWATALNVLGPDAGLQLATAQNIPALFLVRADGGFKELTSPAFAGLRPGAGAATLSPGL